VKKILIMLTSLLLCVTMLTLLPAQVIASAAENKQKYISEVKVGMGETSEQAAKELLAEGYTILSDGKGYADLNKDAGSKSILKGGPNQKIVYLGYKTTDDASEAITDLAVMNMNGGYSFQDYEKLMQQQMDTQIKPFVERFVSTLNEYRENLKKPQDSVNYKRANYYRTLLNKLTDDDAGYKPLGDLLVNQTKYELGDDAYNKLSDAEKKNHCDILTLLMQGNGQAVQLMETELTKASDTSADTWIDRFIKTDPAALTESVKAENPNMTPSEINDELDKQYNDNARKILDKWSAFGEILNSYDDTLEKAEDAAKEINESKNKKEVEFGKVSNAEYFAEATQSLHDQEAAMLKGGMAAEDIMVHDDLEAIKYGDGTLLEFFKRPQSDFTGEDGIRELYPIVEALSGGQLAGLDFLSIKDMVMMAVTDEKGFDTVNLEKVEPASIYQDVNREIYQKGEVALTNAALREKATAQEVKTTYEMSTLGIVLWTCTAAAGVAAVGTGIKAALTAKAAADEAVAAAQAVKNAQVRFDIVKARLDYLSSTQDAARFRLQKYFEDGYSYDNPQEKVFLEMSDDSLKEANRDYIKYLKSDEYQNAVNDLKKAEANQEALEAGTGKSNICKYLSAGFTVAMAVLAGFSIYTTITEMMEYYKVDFAPIPKYIVDEMDITVKNDEGKKIMVQNQTAYYKAVLCNRTDGSSNVEKKNHEILKDRSDLNGDVGMQWLALYSAKYKNGNPILADSFMVQTGKTELPDGYSTGIHRFGEKAAFNLTSKYYCYNDSPNGTFVFFKHDAASVKDLTAAGSMFSGGSIALGALLGVIGSVALMLLLSFSVRKRKETIT